MPPINRKNANTAFTKVAASTTVTDLVAENGGRVGLYIYNAAASDLYIRIDGDATATDFTLKIATGGLYEMPTGYFTDKVSGVLASGTGNVLVTEISN